MAECCWFVQAEDQLAEQLAQLELFQTFVGASTPAEAAERIHHEVVSRSEFNEVMVPAELRAKRPFAMLWSEQPGLSRIADSNSLEFHGQIGLLMEIEIPDLRARFPALTSTPAQARWIKDTGGKILIDLFDRWAGLRQVLTCAWAFSQPLAGHGADFALFHTEFLYGVEQ
jgi:hypothetical protein